MQEMELKIIETNLHDLAVYEHPSKGRGWRNLMLTTDLTRQCIRIPVMVWMASATGCKGQPGNAAVSTRYFSLSNSAVVLLTK